VATGQDRDQAAGRLRAAMVARLWDSGVLHDPPVADVMGRVPRHLFVPEVSVEEAYRDQAIPTKVVGGEAVSSSSQPAIMAIMLEQLAPRPGQRVLEIGAGTGYNAALLAGLVGPAGSVVTVDIDEDLVEGARAHLAAAGLAGAPIEVVCADGAGGWAPGAPYDRIILTVGASDLAPAWLEQLAPDGRLVLPLSVRGVQQSVCLAWEGDHLVSLSLRDCGFMPLRGELVGPERRIPLPGLPGVSVLVPDAREVDAEALARALAGPFEDRSTGLEVGAGALTSLGRWLALRDPASAHLGAQGTVEELATSPVPPLLEWPMPGGCQRLSVCLLGRAALAALTRPIASLAHGRLSPLTVRAWGPQPEAGELARRLEDQALAWDRWGRPATERVRIAAYPKGSKVPDVPGSVVVDTGHARLVVSAP
jgi:protein-L-isoaspartate(D-aspartate) O-methyltransferase